MNAVIIKGKIYIPKKFNMRQTFFKNTTKYSLYFLLNMNLLAIFSFST